MLVSTERLKEIAETEFEDVDALIMAVREIATAVIETRKMAQQQAPPPQRTAPQQQSSGGRVRGTPVLPEMRRTTCKQCHDDVVVFISKRTNKPYLCDIEIGDYQNKRQQLTGVNWLHKCGGGR